MEEIGKKLIWLVLIFPGFLTVTIIDVIADLGDVGDINLTFYSLALTFVDVIIALVISALIVGFLAVIRLSLGMLGLIIVFAVSTLAVSIVVGIAGGIAVEEGTFFETVRKLPILNVLNKRSRVRPLVFLLRQNTAGRMDVEGDGRPEQKVSEAYIRVYLDDDVTFEGWPEFYDSKSTELYLSPACTITKSGEHFNATKIAGPGVVIPESEIKYATLLDRQSSPCYEQYFPQSKTIRP
jgi:hypothetical protein